ncbi:MAG: hypothetical protein M1813_000320 [Trichoglossum hirsutum]|nr:MAG: hypothetical protein M1813_000320 [Trichoglossum hirsutum]
MASLAIIQYNPTRAIASRRPRNDLRVKPITISNSTTIPEKDSNGSSDSDHYDSADLGNLATHVKNVPNEFNSLFDITGSVVGTENGFVTKVGSTFSKASAECEVEVQDSDAEFRANNGMGDNHHLLRRIPRTGGQDNLLVIPDDESDSENKDDLCGRSIERINTDDGTGGIASQIEDFASTSTDLVEPQPVAKVGGNGEWGIHGNIGKEVISGVLHYCVGWEPTVLPIDVLRAAWRMVQEFEAEERARSGKEVILRKGNEPDVGSNDFEAAISVPVGP